MAMKRGLDQTTAWILAVVLTLIVFGIGHGWIVFITSHARGGDDAEVAHDDHEKGHGGDHGGGHEGAPDGGHADHKNKDGHEGGDHADAAHDPHAKDSEHGKNSKHDEKSSGDGHGGSGSHGDNGDQENKAHGDHHNGNEHDKGTTKQGAHWDYRGSSGPEHWADISSDFHTCADGHQQSPIDIEPPIANKKLLPINFHYREGDSLVKHNGHTVEVEVPSGSFVEIEGEHYDLKQFHFHAPSEHKVSGSPFDLEVHLVHKNAEGQLAVIGGLYVEGAANKGLAKIWQELPEPGTKVAEPISFNPASLLPDAKTYYYYDGSLTTPPCSEHVKWFVLTKYQEISPKQVEVFNHVVAYNARPVQRLNGRKVVKSAR